MKLREYEIIQRGGIYTKGISAVSPYEAASIVLAGKNVKRLYNVTISELADVSVYLANSRRKSVVHYIAQYSDDTDMEEKILKWYYKMGVPSYYQRNSTIICGFIAYLVTLTKHNRDFIKTRRILEETGFSPDNIEVIMKLCEEDRFNGIYVFK